MSSPTFAPRYNRSITHIRICTDLTNLKLPRQRHHDERIVKRHGESHASLRGRADRARGR
jgi:hypothetical protein